MTAYFMELPVEVAAWWPRLRAPHECFAADVVAKLHPRERDLQDGCVRTHDRFGEVAAVADDGQHPSAGRLHLAVTAPGAAVVDRDARNLRRAVDPGDRLAGVRRLGIAARRE